MTQPIQININAIHYGELRKQFKETLQIVAKARAYMLDLTENAPVVTINHAIKSIDNLIEVCDEDSIKADLRNLKTEVQTNIYKINKHLKNLNNKYYGESNVMKKKTHSSTASVKKYFSSSRAEDYTEGKYGNAAQERAVKQSTNSTRGYDGSKKNHCLRKDC